MVRGGSWTNSNPDNLRAANRNHNDPGNRNNNYGFRVVCVGESGKAGPTAKWRDVGWELFLPGQCQEAQPNSVNPAPRTRGKDAARAVAGKRCPAGRRSESHGPQPRQGTWRGGRSACLLQCGGRAVEVCCLPQGCERIRGLRTVFSRPRVQLPQPAAGHPPRFVNAPHYKQKLLLADPTLVMDQTPEHTQQFELEVEFLQ